MNMKKKLIEVSLPLEVINQACLDESSVPRRGHTSTLHPWWAKRPLAACSAVIYSSIIDDPSNYLPAKEADKERKRLFKIIEDFIRWENRGNTKYTIKVREEIGKFIKDNKTILIDPFSGRGNIPFEAQRLGINVVSSDYNPVAVIIEKGVVEIPSKLMNRKPINLQDKNSFLKENWTGCKALARDVKFYGTWIHEEAKKRLKKYFDYSGNSFPSVFIWFKIIKCPNPACACEIPLTASFWLSRRKNRLSYIKPIIFDGNLKGYDIIKGDNNAPKGTVARNGATCVVCDTTIPLNYLREQARKGNIKHELIATIEDSRNGRIYRIATEKDKSLAENINLDWIPSGKMPKASSGLRIQKYGIEEYSQIFSTRQLKVLTTYADLIKEVSEKISKESNGDIEYARAIKLYLAFALDKLAAWNSTICSWIPSIEGIKWTFPRHSLQRSWDFTEINPLGNPPGNWINHVEWVAEFLEQYPDKMAVGQVKQLDATKYVQEGDCVICSTDPPYYDNIAYADLSDFFYIWLRRVLQDDYPDIFSTMLTPKINELIADAARFDGDKVKAENYFEKGMFDFFTLLKERISVDFPVTLYYAFKQEEEDVEDEDNLRTASTGWEKMLEGLLKANFMITGTWPIRTEREARQASNKTNALASSIVIVCRPRPHTSSLSTRREFINTLKKELPPALKYLQVAGIAPVDMAQSTIGPGMAIFSRYSKVLEADGTPMSVRTALQIINQELDSYFVEQESEMDQLTRFAIAWYEQFCWNDGPFGDANTLATAKGTAVNALEQAGIIFAKAGKVRLLKRDELEQEWDPTTDKRLTVWECVQYLIRNLEIEGEAGAANILKKIGGLSEPVKELSYRLYSICEKKGWAEDALAYNSLISSWQSVADKAQFAAGIDEETKKRLKDKSQRTLGEQWGG